MNLLVRIFVFVFLVCWVCCVEFKIVCRKNCDKGSQIDPQKEIELIGECIKACTSSLRFLWELEAQPKNKIKKFKKEDTLGFNTSFLTILPNVLECGEIYDLDLVIKYPSGQTTYVVELSMAKCSRKYPPGERTDETQIENDYSDFDYVEAPEEAKTQGENVLWANIDDAIVALKLMYNTSHTLSIPKKQVEILKLLELVQSSFYYALNETIDLGWYGPKTFPAVTRKVLQAGLTITTKLIDDKGDWPTFYTFGWVIYYINKILRTASYTKYKQLQDLVDHRPGSTKVPKRDQDPQKDTANYPDYNDFDLVYRKRKAIMEDIRWLQYNLTILAAKLRVKARVSVNESYSWMESGAINSATNEIPFRLFVVETTAYFPKVLKEEIKHLLNDTGLFGISFDESLFPKPRSDKYYKTNYLALGSRLNPLALKNVTNPFHWGVPYYFEKFSHATGYLRLPPVWRYDNITDDHLPIHELQVDLPMVAMAVRIETLKRSDVFKIVVRSGRLPTMEDIRGKDTYFAEHFNFATFIPVKASPGTKLYVGLMPTEETLESGQRWERFRNFNYKIYLVRLQCEYIDESDLTVDLNPCNISVNSHENGFNCSCTKFGLYQFSQIVIRSRFVEDKPIYEEPEEKPPLNFVPSICLGAVAFVYIVALISKKINKQSHVVAKRVQHLMDNDLSHQFPYVLVVTTQSSTTANIAFQLHGSKASTPPHLFRGQSEPVLQRHSDDWFYLLAEKDLGNLQSLDLWSDCYGFKPSWYCSRIKVINQKTKQEWMFQVNDWFNPIDKKTSKTIKIENPEETFYFQRYVYAIKGLSNHLWVKTFTKLQNPIFTFNERIHILMSIFTMNMMLTMLLLKFSHDNVMFWHFGYSGYDIGSYEILSGCTSGLCTFLFTALLIFFFSNSARCGSKTSTESVGHRTCCRIVSWVVMVFVILGSCTVVAFFGLFTGFITSIVWLYTFLIGVGFCIILECFRVMLIGYINRNIDSKILTIDYKSIEIQRKKIAKGLGMHGMRFLLQKYYSKLSDEEIKEKETKAQEIKMLRFEKSEFITYIIYMVIMFVIILYDRDPLCHISANNIRDIFIEDKYLRKIELSEINSQKRFYRYMSQVFLPAIHSTTWYGSYGSSAPGRLIDFNSKMLGTARIRQSRIQNGTCEVPQPLQHFVDICHSEFSWFVQDKQNYGEFWRPYNASAEKLDSDGSWFYRGWWQMKALPFIGELAVYPGGGYTIKFGRTWSNSRIILRYMKNTNWIDERTRAIFLDVNFYNVNDNLFNFLTIAIEQSATGAFITNYQLNTLRFLYHGEIMSIILPFMWSSLSLFLVIFAWNKFYQYKEFHSSSCRQLLTDYWNLVDFLIISLIFCLLVTLGVRFLVIENILRDTSKISNVEFFSYNGIILCQKAIEIITAILITFSTIRLWKLLRYLRQFRLFELTLSFSIKYLLSMMVINTILILVYAGVGFLILGPYVREFRTIWSSFVALMLISFGLEFNLGFDSSHQTMYSYIGYIYFTGYLILVLVLLNIFITIIVVGYKNSKEYLDCQVPQIKYNILTFLKDDCAYNQSRYKGRIRNITIVKEMNKALQEFRLRAGQDRLLPNISTASSSKILHNAQSMLEIHQLADKATTLIQEKYHYNADEKHERTLQVLGYYYYRFSDESQPKTNIYNEYLVTLDDEKENIYCSMKRQNDIKSIVEYLVNRKGTPRTLASIEGNKTLIEGQLRDVINMRTKSEQMIATLEKLLLEGCRTKSTQADFQDVEVEASSSSDDIELEFEDGNITVYYNV